MYGYDSSHKIALILNALFLILMPIVFKYGNVFIMVIWIILVAVNTIFIFSKNKKMKKEKRYKQ